MAKMIEDEVTYAQLYGLAMATSTGWARHPISREVYAIVLENEDGQPFAMASYKYETWLKVFEHLRAMHEELTSETMKQ